ncbi:unnamed protein product [Sphagnum tenellum]
MLLELLEVVRHVARMRVALSVSSVSAGFAAHVQLPCRPRWRDDRLYRSVGTRLSSGILRRSASAQVSRSGSKRVSLD